MEKNKIQEKAQDVQEKWAYKIAKDLDLDGNFS